MDSLGDRYMKFLLPVYSFGAVISQLLLLIPTEPNLNQKLAVETEFHQTPGKPPMLQYYILVCQTS